MRSWSLLILSSLLAGCPKAGSPEGSGTSVGTAGGSTASVAKAEQITSSVTADGLTEVKVDLDRDGRAEIVNYYRERTDGRLLLRKDTDLDRDGRIDVRTEFDDAGQRTK